MFYENTTAHLSCHGIEIRTYKVLENSLFSYCYTQTYFDKTLEMAIGYTLLFSLQDKRVHATLLASDSTKEDKRASPSVILASYFLFYNLTLPNVFLISCLPIIASNDSLHIRWIIT